MPYVYVPMVANAMHVGVRHSEAGLFLVEIFGFES